MTDDDQCQGGHFACGICWACLENTRADLSDARIAELEEVLSLRTNLHGEACHLIEQLEAERDRLHERAHQLRHERDCFATGEAAQKARAEAAEAKMAVALGVLTRIGKWTGEFPDTGEFWDNGSPISYATLYGSSGERDFMRNLARDTLAQLKGTDQ